MEFHLEFKPYFANYIVANSSTILLLKSCFVISEKVDFGSDGYDLDTELKIEEYSKRQTVYALGSEIKENKDEPLFLVTDDKVSDGAVILKYISDRDDEGGIPSEPINTGIQLLMSQRS